MSIFKKKQRSIYESQPRIDFNDSLTAPIVHSYQPLDQPLDQPLTKPVLAPETPFQKVNFERESELQPSSEVSSNTSVLTTSFIADSYNDAPKMADLLLIKGQLIVHLEKLPKGERVRLLDFISGVMYAFNGDVQKIEHRTYQFTIQKDA
ncbi:cell division protein SepF [Spiroplasma endosymbiont of Megaselia nigra]|uniref:cell division protein SepF n=1 Tax=Spiroplasma endosymbiont of Megaselia nigra TaxID=2478537 RepID=UPI000F86C43B|nr:cell division protein SepF [Spiroplasma endosymbiont of Megaselia nigra]RUO86659.1 cell division protein SepF [Spiroplasma endosymbiont of Megaselia nigra]